MTRRVLHLMDYQPLGTRAFDHFILEYARQACARGWQPFFAFTGEPTDAFAALLKERGAEWFRLPNPFNADAAARLPGGPFDVVQSSFFSPFDPAMAALRIAGVARRLVLIDHSSGTGSSPWSVLTPLRWLRGRRVGGIIDGMACVSAFNARRAVHRVFLPSNKITVVPNGIALEHFPFNDDRHNDPPRVVYAGQLTKAKGVLTLIDAVKRLAEVPFTLEIAGCGPLADELARTAPPCVTLLGHVPDVAKLYAHADVAVVPSQWAEAFGLVVIEAMACGAAMLASDAGALPEVTADAGMLFRAGDASDLATQLRALLQSRELRARLRARGRDRVERHYQLHDCIRRHLDFAGL